MAQLQQLKAVSAQPGRPLYMVVRDAVRDAIDAGVFKPGEQMPSTKELSQRLNVSLVTTHRAMQELVTTGVLERSQGKGTFVHQRYRERVRTLSNCRLGLVFHNEASLADFYHSQILEGVRQAAQTLAIDLILLRFGEDVRNECNGFLFVNPLPGEVESLGSQMRRRLPTFIVGARSHMRHLHSIDVDNIDLARQAVQHLASLGHRNLAYVGGADQISNSRDRWHGFLSASQELRLPARSAHVVAKDKSWRLDDVERTTLLKVLSAADRPTAIFAAGYYFALDVYGAAASLGLRVPEELSILGVDDPPSAQHLSPPMSTLRQPLVQLGHAAVTSLYGVVAHGREDVNSRTLLAELVVRRSTGPAPQ